MSRSLLGSNRVESHRDHPGTQEEYASELCPRRMEKLSICPSTPTIPRRRIPPGNMASLTCCCRTSLNQSSFKNICIPTHGSVDGRLGGSHSVTLRRWLGYTHSKARPGWMAQVAGSQGRPLIPAASGSRAGIVNRRPPRGLATWFGLRSKMSSEMGTAESPTAWVFIPPPTQV